MAFLTSGCGGLEGLLQRLGGVRLLLLPAATHRDQFKTALTHKEGRMEDFMGLGRLVVFQR